MKLVQDWRTVLRRAWSVRLALLAAAFTAWASWWAYRIYGTPLYITIPAVALNFAVAASRIVKQGYSDADA
ncbi:hypothetical protein [Acidovorax sp. Leaf160]|uniref:DUF7940 domain-containing protein n=1 Tax=Acidovorax sp. Leaf160 TaxID=1736280 RepID=UPI0006FF594F|nr:hypothetical protein [Acidovorax sp. Leaf160]KQR55627.1 hypothetical protein ASF94_04275 [Acidovorax sp. Leaf160]